MSERLVGAVVRRSIAVSALGALLVAPPTPARAEAATDGQIDAFLGTRKEGWTPRCAAVLKRNMTPAEAGAVVKGADKKTGYGIVTLPAPAEAKAVGVDKMEIHFLDDDKKQPRLYSVVFVFDTEASEDEAFYDALVKALVAKYGKRPPEDIAKKLVTWVGPNSAMAQLHVADYGSRKEMGLDVTLEERP
jgi:hypothetical protein